jgi:hypothetical protein
MKSGIMSLETRIRECEAYPSAWITLSAPNNLPTSVPPALVYSASATLCSAGLNPAPNEPRTANTVNGNGRTENAMAVYATISVSKEKCKSLRSKDGEWITFLMVFGVCDSDWASDELPRSGLDSLAPFWMGTSITTGFGLRTLMATIDLRVDQSPNSRSGEFTYEEE